MNAGMRCVGHSVLPPVILAQARICWRPTKKVGYLSPTFLSPEKESLYSATQEQAESSHCAIGVVPFLSQIAQSRLLHATFCVFLL